MLGAQLLQTVPAPAGAKVLAGGGVRFRLWAPAQDRVSVTLDGAAPLAMRKDSVGWHEVVAPVARAGDRYRFRLADGREVPDPASRFQPEGVHGPSEVVDLASLDRPADGWRGRPFGECVLYELHVGTFSAAGTYAGVEAQLGRLAGLGITAVELMPIGAFGGDRGWGYDGVLPYAPHHAYGTPADLCRLVDAAHAHGLMMFLDVVYNHFGPAGNDLPTYCPEFFDPDNVTVWGPGIDFRRRPVRDYVIGNAMMWLGEYGFDGLRLDAVHAIADASQPHVLEELARTARASLPDREVHLVLENEHNEAHRLGGPQAGSYDAQWADDWHHCIHVAATGESEAYYRAFIDQPAAKLAKAQASGFVYQGEPSPIHDGRPRGQPSGDLPPTAFVTFLQNHDQIGNRALGERLTELASPLAVEAGLALLLLAPQPPLLFMGEEWGSTRPFFFFTDFDGELAEAVREGRRREFAGFAAFSDPEIRERIPDPNDPATALASTLDPAEAETPAGRTRLALVGRLLALRREHVWPLLPRLGGRAGSFQMLGETAVRVVWKATGGGGLAVAYNLGPEPASGLPPLPGRVIYAQPQAVLAEGRLGPWSVVWSVAAAGEIG